MGNCASLCGSQKPGVVTDTSSSSSSPGVSTCGKVEAAVAAAFDGKPLDGLPAKCAGGLAAAQHAAGHALKDRNSGSTNSTESPGAPSPSQQQQRRVSPDPTKGGPFLRIAGGTDGPASSAGSSSRLTAAPWQQLDAMVPPVWSLSLTAQGQPHDAAKCGAPRVAYESSRVLTTQALKLMSADLSPEIDVILNVLNEVVGVALSVVSLYGGPGGTMWLSHSTAAPILGFYEWEAVLCPWMLLSPVPTMMLVEDVLQDARYSHTALAQALKTFASAPIIASNGQAFGSICALDFEKNYMLDVGQCRLLSNFAELATREFERHAEVAQRLKDKDELLYSAFKQPQQPMRRNLASSYDSCIIVVDVSKGFEVKYLNTSWDQWSGGMSRDTVVGRSLSDVLESVTAEPVSWNQIAADAVSGQRFVISRVHVRNPNAEEPPPVFDITFRCGALEALDNDTLPVVVPPYVKLTTNLGAYYFGRLHAVAQTTFTPLDATSHACPSTMSPHDMAASIIPGLKLKQGLGRGGFGTAYLADWHDMPVVCKVQDHLLHNEEQRAQAEREIALGQSLDHPNIVRVLAHATMLLSRHLPSNLVKAKRPLCSQRLVDFWVDDLDEFDFVDNFDDGASSMFESMIDGSEPPAGQWPTTSPSTRPTTTSTCRPGGAETPIGHWPTTQMSSRFGGGGSEAMSRQSTQDNRDSNPLRGPHDCTRATSCLRLSIDKERPSPSPSSTLPDVADLSMVTIVRPGGRDDDNNDKGMTLTEVAQRRGPVSFGSGVVVEEEGVDGDEQARRRYLAAAAEGADSVGGASCATRQSALSQFTARTAYQYPVELRVFLVMELCDKGCLQDAIDSGKFRERPHVAAAPVQRTVLRTALDIADALQYLHKSCIIHGDLTGYNILLKSIPSDAKLLGLPDKAPVTDAAGRPFIVKIADFGTSRRVPNVDDYLRVDMYGTFTHMPPEMFVDKSLSSACDVWAFGVLLWSLWTGSRPWAGLSHDQTKAIVIDNSATLQYPPTTPPAIAALGAWCLAHNAQDRPPIGAVCAELESLLARQ